MPICWCLSLHFRQWRFISLNSLSSQSNLAKPYFFSTFPSSPPSDQTPTTQSLVSTAVSILTHHRSKSRWSYLRSLCPNGFEPNEFSKITIDLKNNPHLALRFFLWTQQKSLCNHNVSSYSTIIHVLARGRLKSHAQDIIRTAIRASKLEGCDGEDQSASKPLKVFETLVKTYKDCGSAPFVFDLLIKACLGSKKVDPSIEIVRMLQSRGISPKVSTLNSLICGVCRCHGVDAGYAIYRELFGLDTEFETSVRRVVRVRPNVHTFNALMLCFHGDGSVDKVEEIWNEMAKLDCARNSYSYTVLMAAYCEEGRMGQAEKLWQEMKSKGMEPGLVTYNTIIGGFCKTGEIRRAEEFFRDMSLGGTDSTSATYEHLIEGHCNVGDVDSALLVYKDMCRRALRPETSTLDMIIGILCDKGRIHDALEFMRSARSDFGISPKGKSYTALIKGLCNEGKMEEALKLQAEMVGKGFEPNSEIYGAFIGGYVRQGNEEVAGALRKEMLESQMQEKES
ncbi:Pentatricopeptide repeat-containing protein [Quillaja saponaria]|uniref:Pentatricopeptide repeat-containing protein n=1 Tax=Quillaja saponaria TaxID=32244 RepID=A0AAD7P881_QUISA|nr:Pentatricopeptide repeat-containing protein [Quillaja saponaria]KAJ7945989.1 Pentatricopeptide repeat-containing protein [Quillaja saponaria]